MERPEYARMAALEDTLWWYRALHRDLLAALDSAGLPRGARVLDAGCGTGGFLSRLTAARPDLAVDGLELDEEAAAMTRGKTGLSVLVGSIDRMPYPSGSFSAIVSADVLCHAGVDQHAALTEFHRCLQKGGLLLLNLPAYQWLWSAHDDRVQSAQRYTATGARELALAAGFSQVQVGYRNSLLFPLMLLHRLGKRRGDSESDVRPFPEWQDRLFFGVTDSERGLRARGIRVPFGGSIRVEARK
jgi:SAM-dependent methyltransferase